jgi:hypothetical protein
MLELLKEAFLSIFVVAYRINRGAWPASFNADAHKAVAAVTFVELMACLTIYAWVQILSGSHIEFFQPVLWVGAFTFYIANYYFLLTKKLGSDFEKRFDRYSKARRTTLRIAALIIFFGVFALFLISVPYYQHAFHILPRGNSS